MIGHHLNPRDWLRPCRAGRHLSVLVTAAPAEAGRLLDSASLPPGARIWPLAGLAAADATAAQRRAAAQFAPGQVLLPLDLLAFAPADRPALLRAFGGCVIAADDTGSRWGIGLLALKVAGSGLMQRVPPWNFAVAEALLSRHGLRSITLDGSIHSRGSLQGGWRGDSAARRAGGVPAKLELDAARAELEAVEKDLARVSAALTAAEADVAAAEDAREAAAQVRDGGDRGRGGGRSCRFAEFEGANPALAGARGAGWRGQGG